MREKLRDRVFTVSVPQLSLHIPRDSLPTHLGGTLEINHSSWLDYCRKSMSREEDELLPQTTPNHSSIHDHMITTAAISSGNIATNTLNGLDVTKTSTSSVTNNQSANEFHNGVESNVFSITDITQWAAENPPSSASSGFSDDDSLTGANDIGDHKTIEKIVDMVRERTRKGLIKEYAEIRARQPSGTFDHAKLRNNLAKNRYTDVLCYDHSRVVLSHDDDDDPTSDYINANFVDGYKQKNAYISTQGKVHV